MKGEKFVSCRQAPKVELPACSLHPHI